MHFSSKDYLPNSEEKIIRLQKIIDGRPVAILAAGPSIEELERRIGELRNADICYFGLNNFFVQEAHILEQINRRFSVVMCSSREGIPVEIKAIISFLNRDENNILISSFWRDAFGLLDTSFNLSQFLDNYHRKLLFFSLNHRKNVPNNDYPLHFILSNSLLTLIQLALIGKASSIVLFGADGHCGVNVEKCHYRPNEYEANMLSYADLSLIQDTEFSFNPLASIAIKNTCKTHSLPLINILNCSEKSFYTPFTRVSYDNALEYLVTGKKLIGKLDLRVPIKPKKSNLSLLIKLFIHWLKVQAKRNSNIIKMVSKIRAIRTNLKGRIEYFFHYLIYKQHILKNKVYLGSYMEAKQVNPYRRYFMQKMVENILINRDASKFVLLEIGSWAGGSAIIWAEAIKKSNSSGEIYCVDPWVKYETTTKIMSKALKRNKIFDLFNHNINVSGLGDMIFVLRGSSEKILPMLRHSQFDLIFIDADHSYEAVIRDLQNASHLLKEGGVLCGDDLELQYFEIDIENGKKNKEKDYIVDLKTKQYFHPGVCLAVGEFFNKEVSSWHGFWAMRKKANEWEEIKLDEYTI